MLACFRVRGLIAASAYDDMTDRERRVLEKHLAKCAACRAEADALARLVTRIPFENIEQGVDLVPVLKRELAEAETPVQPRTWKVAFFTASCVAVCILFVTVLWGELRVEAPSHRTAQVEQTAPGSPVRATLDQVYALMDTRDYPRAYQLLKETIQAHPDDTAAGEAQRLLAEIAFEKLRWYRQADEAYEKLAGTYKTAYETNPNLSEMVARRELLAEARKNNYRPLEAFDAALRSLGNTFKNLENLIAQYPGTYVASLAAEALARETGDETGGPEASQSLLAAMEKARDRCTNPVAIAQLNLEMGHIYRDQLNNAAKARDFYVEAAKSDNEVLVRLAQGSLTQIDGREGLEPWE